MLIKITDAPLKQDNPWLTQDPVLGLMEDKHLRWLAFYVDPWSPLRFMEDGEARLRKMAQLVPGVECDHTLIRPKDCDVFLWDKALAAYAELCPENEMLQSLEARKTLIRSLREEETFTMPSAPRPVDVQRHKTRMDIVKNKLVTKAIEELESMYGRLTYKPVITTIDQAKELEGGKATAEYTTIDTIKFE